MAFKHHKSFFVQEEIEALQRAFDNACFALGLEREDRVRRERLGALVFEIAETGLAADAVLAAHVVRRFRGAGIGHASSGPSIIDVPSNGETPADVFSRSTR